MMANQPLPQPMEAPKEQPRLNHELQPPPGGSDTSKHFVLIIVVVVMVSGVVLYLRSGSSARQQPTGNTPQVAGAGNVSADDDAYLGVESAPVTIIEFSDFQCPFCRKFWKETFPQLRRAYIDTGKVRWVFRDFPLPFHAGAIPAAEGAECAREQGKFWAMHDVIFTEQGQQGSGTIPFTADDVKRWAAKIGLNADTFNPCLDAGKYRPEIAKDIADGKAAGVNGTPAFFVNGRPVVGAQPFAAFKVVIDEELKKLGK